MCANAVATLKPGRSAFAYHLHPLALPRVCCGETRRSVYLSLPIGERDFDSKRLLSIVMWSNAKICKKRVEVFAFALP